MALETKHQGLAVSPAEDAAAIVSAVRRCPWLRQKHPPQARHPLGGRDEIRRGRDQEHLFSQDGRRGGPGAGKENQRW